MKEQTIAKRIGETGCYFLCIMYLADKITDSHFDIIEAYKKYISMNYLGEDCFVMNPGEILSDLTGRNMRFDKAGILAVVPDDAHIIDSSVLVSLFLGVALGSEIAQKVTGK
jgi:hypothetical protein